MSLPPHLLTLTFTLPLSTHRYLSDRELGIVNSNIKKISDYANSATARAVRGDSFGAIALRSNAFKVAKAMIEAGLDPLVENEEGEDMFGILEEQYNRMTGTSVRLAIFGVVFVYVFVYLSPIHANPLLPPPPPQGKCTKSWWKRKKGHTASLCPLSKA